MNAIEGHIVIKVKKIKDYKIIIITNFILFIWTEVVIIPPNIEVHPVATIGELYQSTSLTCKASGNPSPHIIWYKDNVVIPNDDTDLSVLFFDELRLDDRGFYRCEAIINCTTDSDVSEDVVLNIRG